MIFATHSLVYVRRWRFAHELSSLINIFFTSFKMGKTQSHEQVVIAQTGAGNQADSSLFHEITHSKLDVIIIIIVATLLIAFCYILSRCGKSRYTTFLRNEMRDLRASRRGNEVQRPAPVYSVA